MKEVLCKYVEVDCSGQMNSKYVGLRAGIDLVCFQLKEDLFIVYCVSDIVVGTGRYGNE
jgi:hypothetical protein